MKKRPFLFGTGILVFILGLTYYLGPQPEKPDFDKVYDFELPSNLTELQSFVKNKESQIDGLKKDNEAQFVWADSIPEVTDYAIVYIHGFSASRMEGNPVHENLARKYHANLYKARMAEHGIDRGDETMANLTADKYIETAEEALAIGRKIGKKVIIAGTSAGGALTLYLASKHKDLEAIILYSPCVKIYDPSAELLDDPWGLKLGTLVQGKPFNDITPANENQPLYWSVHYRLEGLVALQNFITHAMVSDTFEKINCPVFMGYYYKDEEHQDKVVSVPALLTMFDALGSSNKTKVAFPNAENHVLASWVLSKDVDTVQEETEKFLDEILK